MFRNYLIIGIILFLFLNNNSINAQKKSGKLSYSTKIKSETYFDMALLPSNVQKFQQEVDAIIPSLTFSLEFNHSNSIFYMNPFLGLEKEDLATNIAIMTVRGDNVYYADLKKKKLLEQTNFLGEKFLVEMYADSIDWELKNEQKYIGKFLCYKAELLKERLGKHSEENKYIKHVVWFCPELTFNFGPFESFGLPGLVLEYSVGGLVFETTEIQLNDYDRLIKEPKDGQLISKQEFDRLGKNNFENKKQLMQTK
jgi:GLPGLI family protein